MELSKKQFYCALTVSCAMMFTEVYSIFFVTSYLPEMTLWLGYHENDKGFYVGLITALYSVGAVCTCYPLGWVSDKLGHREVIISLLLAKVAYCLVHAFATNLVLILIAQFLIGSSSALLSSSRAVLSIYSSDDTQTFAMAFNVLAVSLGMNIGSTIGGYLASPATKYPQYFGRILFFKTFPYFLPPFLALVFSVVTAVIVWFVYPTKNAASSTTSNESNLCLDERTQLSSVDVILPVYDSVNESTIIHMLPELTQTNETNLRIEISETLSTNKDKSNITQGESKRHIKHINCSKETKTDDSNGLRKRYMNLLAHSSLVYLLKNSNVMKVVIIYSLLFTVEVSYLDIFAVWASTVDNLGGLDYSTDTIGSIQMIIVFPCAIVQLIIAPVVERRLGSIHAFMLYAVSCAITISLVPLIRMLKDVWVQWYVILFSQAVFAINEVGLCITAAIIVNNSVALSHVGAVNGLTRTVSGLIRSVFSIAIGSVYATSLTSQFGAPVDPSLVFVLMGMTLWIASIVAYFIPKQLNYKFVE